MKRITSSLTTLVLAQGGNMTEKQLIAFHDTLPNLVGPTSTLRVLYYCVATGRAIPTSAEDDRELRIKWFNSTREESEERHLHAVEAEDVLECIPKDNWRGVTVTCSSSHCSRKKGIFFYSVKSEDHR